MKLNFLHRYIVLKTNLFGAICAAYVNVSVGGVFWLALVHPGDFILKGAENVIENSGGRSGLAVELLPFRCLIMAPLDLDKYVEISRHCKYLPENDLKVSFGSRQNAELPVSWTGKGINMAQHWHSERD